MALHSGLSWLADGFEKVEKLAKHHTSAITVQSSNSFQSLVENAHPEAGDSILSIYDGAKLHCVENKAQSQLYGGRKPKSAKPQLADRWAGDETDLYRSRSAQYFHSDPCYTETIPYSERLAQIRSYERRHQLDSSWKNNSKLKQDQSKIASGKHRDSLEVQELKAIYEEMPLHPDLRFFDRHSRCHDKTPLIQQLLAYRPHTAPDEGDTLAQCTCCGEITSQVIYKYAPSGSAMTNIMPNNKTFLYPESISNPKRKPGRPKSAPSSVRELSRSGYVVRGDVPHFCNFVRRCPVHAKNDDVLLCKSRNGEDDFLGDVMKINQNEYYTRASDSDGLSVDGNSKAGDLTSKLFGAYSGSKKGEAPSGEVPSDSKMPATDEFASSLFKDRRSDKNMFRRPQRHDFKQQGSESMIQDASKLKGQEEDNSEYDSYSSKIQRGAKKGAGQLGGEFNVSIDDGSSGQRTRLPGPPMAPLPEDTFIPNIPDEEPENDLLQLRNKLTRKISKDKKQNWNMENNLAEYDDPYKKTSTEGVDDEELPIDQTDDEEYENWLKGRSSDEDRENYLAHKISLTDNSLSLLSFDSRGKRPRFSPQQRKQQKDNQARQRVQRKGSGDNMTKSKKGMPKKKKTGNESTPKTGIELSVSTDAIKSRSISDAKSAIVARSHEDRLLDPEVGDAVSGDLESSADTELVKMKKKWGRKLGSARADDFFSMDSQERLNMEMRRRRNQGNFVEEDGELTPKKPARMQAWMSGRLALSKQACRFELPIDMRLFETMTPLEYLGKYCVVSSKRKMLYERVYYKNRDPRISKLGFPELQKALTDVLIQSIDDEKMQTIIQILRIPEDQTFERKLFSGIAAFAERMLYPMFVRDTGTCQTTRERIECADFCGLEWKFHGVNINDDMRRVLQHL